MTHLPTTWAVLNDVNEIEIYEQGTIIKTLPGKYGKIGILPDGRVMCSVNNSFYIWDQQFIDYVVCKGHSGNIYAIIQLIDGRVVSCSGDTTIRIWTGSSSIVLKGHTNLVYRILQLRDGRLVSCSDDCTVRIWDVSDGKCERIITDHSSEIWDLLQLRNGKLVSCSTKVHVFDVTNSTTTTTGSYISSIKTLVELHDGRLAYSTKNGIVRDINSIILPQLPHDDMHGFIQLFDGRLVSYSPTYLSVWSNDAKIDTLHQKVNFTRDYITRVRELRNGCIYIESLNGITILRPNVNKWWQFFQKPSFIKKSVLKGSCLMEYVSESNRKQCVDILYTINANVCRDVWTLVVLYL